MLSSAAGEMHSSAQAIRRLRATPSKDLRTVCYGLLGPQARSINYRQGGAAHTLAVQPGSGAYLIVQRGVKPQRSLGFGGATAAPYGQLTPSPQGLLTKITYELDGKLCEPGLRYVRGRGGAWRSHGTAHDVVHPCPERGGESNLRRSRSRSCTCRFTCAFRS